MAHSIPAIGFLTEAAGKHFFRQKLVRFFGLEDALHRKKKKKNVSLKTLKIYIFLNISKHAWTFYNAPRHSYF